MPGITAMPYEFDDDLLKLSLTAISLDGSVIKPTHQSPDPICLHRYPGWRSLSFNIKVNAGALPDFTRLAPDLANPGEDVDVALLVRDDKARYREGIVLEFDSSAGHWEGAHTLDSRNHFGPVDLIPVVVRKKPGPATPGVSSRTGERLASGSSVRVHVHEAPPFPGQSVDAEWREFDVEAGLRLKSDSAYHLEFGDPDRPKLFLNESYEGLRSIFESTATTGGAARSRDVLLASILSPVLIEMCHLALSEGDPRSLDDVSGWKRSLLLDVARHSPSRSEEKQVASWLDRWDTAQHEVLSELNLYVQKKLGTRKVAEALIRQCTSVEDSEGA